MLLLSEVLVASAIHARPANLLVLLLLLQISRTPLSRLKWKELHALVQSHGFTRTPRTPEQIQADREALYLKKSKYMLKPRVPPAPAAAAAVADVAAGGSGGVSDGAGSVTAVE